MRVLGPLSPEARRFLNVIYVTQVFGQAVVPQLVPIAMLELGLPLSQHL
jgi:hypothetical protein